MLKYDVIKLTFSPFLWYSKLAHADVDTKPDKALPASRHIFNNAHFYSSDETFASFLFFFFLLLLTPFLGDPAQVRALNYDVRDGRMLIIWSDRWYERRPTNSRRDIFIAQLKCKLHRFISAMGIERMNKKYTLWASISHGNTQIERKINSVLEVVKKVWSTVGEGKKPPRYDGTCLPGRKLTKIMKKKPWTRITMFHIELMDFFCVFLGHVVRSCRNPMKLGGFWARHCVDICSAFIIYHLYA